MYARHIGFFGGIENAGIARDRSNFWLPLLTQEQTSNLADTITGYIRRPIKNFGEKGAWACPGTAQFFGYPYYCSRGRSQSPENFQATRMVRKLSAGRPGPFCRNVKNSQCTCSFISMHKLEVTAETMLSDVFTLMTFARVTVESLLPIHPQTL